MFLSCCTYDSCGAFGPLCIGSVNDDLGVGKETLERATTVGALLWSLEEHLKLAEGERDPNGTCGAVLIVSHRYCALGDLHFGEVHLLLAPMVAP